MMVGVAPNAVRLPQSHCLTALPTDSEFGDVADEKRDDTVRFIACMLPYTTVIALAFEQVGTSYMPISPNSRNICLDAAQAQFAGRTTCL